MCDLSMCTIFLCGSNFQTDPLPIIKINPEHEIWSTKSKPLESSISNFGF